ncbi:M20 family metallopeptidase [Microvirga massiliensis]|uniref:M20 family metallopeptidase n=1 Tax=Microvirga massiliensis TaxID=1033741 RepID=UPI00062B6AF9|nr:M20 family metallopeptidase [Microvirga massiliensis]
MTTPLDAVALTRELLAFETINPPGHEQACAEHLARSLEGAGLSVRLHAFGDRRTNLVATVGGNGDRLPLCFTGHLDTVPLGAAPWRFDPFAGEIAEGRLYGRGSSDMKAGVAAFVVAASSLAERLTGTPGVALVITGGEETGCDGAAALARDDVLGRAGALVVAEPTANAPLAGHKGALWLKAVTRGVTAHGSMPELGVNAVYKAARAVSRLEDFGFNLEPHPHLGKPTLNVGSVHGGLNINSVPDRAEIGIDIRTVPGLDHDRLRHGIAGYLGDDVELEPLVDLGPVWTDPRDPWFESVLNTVAAVTAERTGIRTAAYFTDASVLTPAYDGPPTVILGPGEPTMAHQTDEYCRIDHIEQAVEIYRRLILRWCGLA